MDSNDLIYDSDERHALYKLVHLAILAYYQFLYYNL